MSLFYDHNVKTNEFQKDSLLLEKIEFRFCKIPLYSCKNFLLNVKVKFNSLK